MKSAKAFAEMFKDEIFTFFIGPERVKFNLHVSVVSAQSDVLDRLMNGEMLEAKNRHATLPEVDPKVFECFAQFCYTERYLYSIPATIKDPKERLVAAERQQVMEYIGILFWWCALCKARVERGQIDSVDTFPFCASPADDLAHCQADRFCVACGQALGSSKVGLICGGCAMDERCEAFYHRHASGSEEGQLPQHISDNLSGTSDGDTEAGEALLVHAKVAVFANIYNVARLKALAIAAFTDSPWEFSINSDNVESVLETLDYVYENTSSDDNESEDSSKNSIRHLIISFVADNIEGLLRSEKARKVLAKGGEMAVDLLAATAARI